MDPLLAVIAAAVLALAFGAALLLRLRGGGDQRVRGDMIEEQRREAGAPPPAHPVRLDRVDQQAVTGHVADPMAVPEIRQAIAAGRKAEAVRLTRERFGLGHREASELVERRF